MHGWVSGGIRASEEGMIMRHRIIRGPELFPFIRISIRISIDNVGIQYLVDDVLHVQVQVALVPAPRHGISDRKEQKSRPK